MNSDKQQKPTGTFKTWGAAKCDHTTGEVIFLDSQVQRRLTVEKGSDFECLEDGDVRRFVYERVDTPNGQITRLLKIQSRISDDTTFTSILGEKVDA